MDRPLDVDRLVALLAEHGVEYLIIGGVATQVHGHRRTTRDLDVLPSPSVENIHRLASALLALEAEPDGVSGGPAPTEEQLAVAPIVPPLNTRHGSLHILNTVPGAAPYAELRARALTIEYGDVSLAIVGLDDLIAMKRASGRPRDLDDVAALIAANRPT